MGSGEFWIRPLSRSLDQAAQHLGDQFDGCPERLVTVGVDQLVTPGEVEQGNCLQKRPPGDGEKVRPVGSGKSTVAFGGIGGDRDNRSIGEKIITAGKGPGQSNNGIGESK